MSLVNDTNMLHKMHLIATTVITQIRTAIAQLITGLALVLMFSFFEHLRFNGNNIIYIYVFLF